MLPNSFALVDDDKEYAEFLSQYLQERGAQVDVFADSNDLISHPDAYAYDFYVLDLMLPGIDGVDLIRLLRRRSSAGILVASGRLAPDVFTRVVEAGADMYLAKPVQFEQVTAAIEAVQRRVAMAGPTDKPWTLDRRVRQLVAPDGARIDLSEGDMAVIECFVEAQGEPVARDTLLNRLGRNQVADGTDGLNATIFRLRRRIERATPAVVPLQSKWRVGYLFRAPLTTL